MLHTVLVISLIGTLVHLLVDVVPLTLPISRWLWYLTLSVLCVILACAIFGLGNWYLGCAGAGATLFTIQVMDLVVVATDLTFMRFKEAQARLQSRPPRP